MERAGRGFRREERGLTGDGGSPITAAPEGHGGGRSSPHDEPLEAVLRRALRGGGLPAGPGRATVSLDVRDGHPWTIEVTRSGVSLRTGLARSPDTTVISDSATVASVLSGSRSGVEAFLAGDLRVRGNLALSLRLDGLLGDGHRPARFPRSGAVRARGIDTFYLDAGQGPPVVLLHGLGATNASMLTTLWDLAPNHRVIAPDLPGFGDSDKPVRRYDARFFARWLERFLDQLEVDRAHLIGNSMGGRIAIELALRSPARVDRVVLLTPSPAFIRRREFVRVVRLLRPELAVVPLPLRHARIVRGIRSMFARPERVSDAWYAAAADEFLRTFGTARGRIAFFSAARQIYLEEPYGRSGFWDRLRELRRPALFLWGERDRLVPAKFARHVERALPTATSVVLEDCGHVPQYELPDRTHRLVGDFLS